MATATDSTTAPTRALLPRVQARQTIEAEGAGLSFERSYQNEFHDQVAKPELPPEPLLPVDVPHGAAGMPKSEHTPIAVLPIGTMGALSFEDCIGGVPNLGETPEVARADLDAMLTAQAHTLHLRRQLEAAAEHGTALLAALGLPRLVEPDFSLSENPTVLGDALVLVIATLDALDGDPDLEPEPGYDQPEGDGSFTGEDDDDGLSQGEEDSADLEHSLGSLGLIDQQHWSAGGNTDFELDPVDCIEPPYRPEKWEERRARRNEMADLVNRAERLRRHMTRRVPLDSLTFVPPGGNVARVATFSGVVR